MKHLAAYRINDRDGVVAWCGECCRWHHHGLQRDRLRQPRTAHCPGNPPDYVLVDAGPASPAVLADLKRARPRGVS